MTDLSSSSASSLSLPTNNTEDPHALLSQYVQGSNIMQEAKAYFRSKVAIDLLHKLPSSSSLADTSPSSSSTVSAAAASSLLHQIPIALQHAIVAEHLRSHNLRFTLSVLAAEAPISIHHDNIIHINNLLHRLQPFVPHFTLPSSRSPPDTTDNSSATPSPLELLLIILNQYEQSLTKEGTTPVTHASSSSLTRPTFSSSSSSSDRSLADKLNEIENYHKDLITLQETTSGNVGHNAKVALNNIRKEMQERFDKELSMAITKLRNEESSRIRTEERNRYETLLRETQASLPTVFSSASPTIAHPYDTSVSLQTARDEASSMAFEIRQRLVNELDSLAVRENQLRKAITLENRAMELEKERHQDEVRRLMGRIREAEDLARNAEIKAKISFEKWKNEFILEIERRETTLSADEQRIKDHLAKAQAAERDATSSITRIPLLLSEIEGLKNEKATLLLTIERETAAAYGAQLRLDALSKTLQEEQQRLNAASARAEAAEATALRATSNANSTTNDITKQREEWTAAIRMLRNRLAAAAAKVKSQTKKMDEMEQQFLNRLETAVNTERKSLDEAQRQWNHERASLLIELRKYQELTTKESRKADEAIAQISGYQAKINELERIIQGLRNDAKSMVLMHTGSNSGSGNVSGYGYGSNVERNSYTNTVEIPSLVSSSSSFSSSALLSTSIQRDQLLLSNEHRRFTADPNILKALEALNNNNNNGSSSTSKVTKDNSYTNNSYTKDNSSYPTANSSNGTVTPPFGPSSTNTSAILHSNEKLPPSVIDNVPHTIVPPSVLSFAPSVTASSFISNNAVSNTLHENSTDYNIHNNSITASSYATITAVKPPLPPSSQSDTVTTEPKTDTGGIVTLRSSAVVSSTVKTSTDELTSKENTSDKHESIGAENTVGNKYTTSQFDIEESYEDESPPSPPIRTGEQSPNYTDEDIGYGDDDLY